METYRRILQRLGAAQDILDVGCDDGRLANFLARETNKKIVGLDISNRHFAQAKEEAGKAGIPGLVECVRSDVQRMALFWDGQFEAVTLVYTLHHIDDPEAALKEIQSTLKPQGEVLIGDWMVREGRKRSICHKFTVREIQRMLEIAGFQNLEVEQVRPGLVLVMGEK